jgi:hypothetical protein
VTEERPTEDPIVTNFKFQITRVQDLVGSGAEVDDPIFVKLLDIAEEIKGLADSTILGDKTREQMSHWTDTLKERLDSLGEQLSVESARDLHEYLNNTKLKMETNSQAS